MNTRNFQGSASEQGAWWEATCRLKLKQAGFKITKTRWIHPRCGVEVDIVVENRHGIELYVDCKGSMDGDKPGNRRTDTMRKAVAELSLLHYVDDATPKVLMSSHLPIMGVGLIAHRLLHEMVPFDDINPLSIEDTYRLRRLADARVIDYDTSPGLLLYHASLAARNSPED